MSSTLDHLSRMSIRSPCCISVWQKSLSVASDISHQLPRAPEALRCTLIAHPGSLRDRLPSQQQSRRCRSPSCLLFLFGLVFLHDAVVLEVESLVIQDGGGSRALGRKTHFLRLLGSVRTALMRLVPARKELPLPGLFDTIRHSVGFVCTTADASSHGAAASPTRSGCGCGGLSNSCFFLRLYFWRRGVPVERICELLHDLDAPRLLWWLCVVFDGTRIPILKYCARRSVMIGRTAFAQVAALGGDEGQELGGVLEPAHVVLPHQLLLWHLPHNGLNGHSWVIELLELDAVAQHNLRLLLGRFRPCEDNSGAVHELHLRVQGHGLGHGRHTRRRAHVDGTRALQRVNQRRLSDIGIANDADRDGRLQAT
mmetsp:Transcript_24872/g.63346  ORF Transcript_24872/g.63346 Transcript_24872/m.63346 type:complete len:369 (+) Transcript_24872:357-1463(+)